MHAKIKSKRPGLPGRFAWSASWSGTIAQICEFLPNFDQLSAITGIGRFSAKVQKYVKTKEKPEISQLKISGFRGDPSGIRTPDTLLKRQNGSKIAYKIPHCRNRNCKYISNFPGIKCNFSKIMHFSGLENGLER